MEYKNTEYFHVAHARDLTGYDRFIFKLLEILPGFLSWGTLLLVVLLSIYLPFWAAVFIIIFDLYWLFKTVYLSAHHYYNWRRMKYNIEQDWNEMLSKTKYEHLYHLVLLPYVNEGTEVIENTLEALEKSTYDNNKILVVLGTEERAGDVAQQVAKAAKEKFGEKFGEFMITAHPSNIPGEIKGKGPNISYMAEEARKQILNVRDISYEDVIVSAFDVDTIVWPQYFSCVSWHYLTIPNPLKASFQPVPLYNNNIWHAPLLSRVAATSSTFWQMIQQERPEKLVSFSSHSLVFKTLYEGNYWQRNMISDDSRIYWNLYFANDGNYRTIPISYPVSMDANLAESVWKTMKNIYRQHLRWMWGVENIPYMLFGFIKNKKIALRDKISRSMHQIYGFWSLATNPLIILLLGWLPIILGGEAFRDTILSYNLPVVTRNIMLIAMLGLVLSAIVAVSLLPPMPINFKQRKRRWVISVVQWIFVPFTIIFFASIPGLHAQTKLMFGNYMGAFWVTPKPKNKRK